MRFSSSEERREMRLAARRRRRGGDGRAPVVVQERAARAAGWLSRPLALAREITAGNRPFALGLVMLLVLAFVLLSGPGQSLVEGRGRLELLERKRDVLVARNGELEQRVADLRDPDFIEQQARRDGFIMPGEVPYAIDPPLLNPTQIGPTDEFAVDVEEPSWWGALVDLVTFWN